MFGGGGTGGGGGGDLWAALPAELAIAGRPPMPLPVSCPFAYYEQGFATSQPSVWTTEENRVFEAALVEFQGASEAELCCGIAARIPGKTCEDVREHYLRLVQDVIDIETGMVELPEYVDARRPASSSADGSDRRVERGQRQTSRAKPEERKKGMPWTEDEHKRFLEGLNLYGKGDWRSISRNCVKSRTPTQVASHAQKYFIRQSMNGNRERRRSSIHDVT